MPIDRLELAEFGRFVSGKYQFLKCADFAAQTGCADFEADPRTHPNRLATDITTDDLVNFRGIDIFPVKQCVPVAVGNRLEKREMISLTEPYIFP